MSSGFDDKPAPAAKYFTYYLSLNCNDLVVNTSCHLSDFIIDSCAFYRITCSESLGLYKAAFVLVESIPYKELVAKLNSLMKLDASKRILALKVLKDSTGFGNFLPDTYEVLHLRKPPDSVLSFYLGLTTQRYYKRFLDISIDHDDRVKPLDREIKRVKPTLISSVEEVVDTPKVPKVEPDIIASPVSGHHFSIDNKQFQDYLKFVESNKRMPYSKSVPVVEKKW